LGGLLSDELDLLLAVSSLVILCTFVDVLLTILPRKFPGLAVQREGTDDSKLCDLWQTDPSRATSPFSASID